MKRNHAELASDKRLARQASPELARAKDKAYRDRNRDRINAQVRARKAANPEKVKTWAANYRKQNRDKLASNQRAYARCNPSKIIDGKMVQMYGLAKGEYAERVVAQEGRCAICGGPPTGKGGRLHVDHCHASQHVRGLLCQHCNVMLGMARESSDILRSAADYLERKLPISPGSKE